MTTYPLIPKTTAHLRPGQFWSIPMSDGRLISFGGGAIVGERPLEADGIEPPTSVDRYWGDGYAVMRVERRFIAGDPPPTSDFREVSSPLAGEKLRPALTYPHLKAITPGLGSRRKNEAAAALLGLPPVSGPYDWRRP